jgi:hypothetical protein
MKAFTATVFLLALVSGCSTQAPAPESQAHAYHAKPIDCSTAAADIKTLTDEKARTSQEIEDGASSIIPIGAVAHIFGGNEKDSIAIGTSLYSKKLDSKITDIRTQCNIQ